MTRHVGIVSVLFDAKPEGICTGRLVRALLENGYRVTLFTSVRAKLGFEHEQLKIYVLPTSPKEPKLVLRAIAKLSGKIPNNFYVWSERVRKLNLKSSDIPDLFYGRAWPFASLVPAYFMSIKYGRPLALHLSDPFPPPNEEYNQVTNYYLQTMIDRADAISFTNDETVAYQATYSKFGHAKPVVIPHVLDGYTQLGKSKGIEQYYYVGGVGPQRPADPLLQGFKKYLCTVPSAKLHFVGASSEYLGPLIQSLDLSENVLLHSFTDDLLPHLSAASALVCIDALVDEPIFTPTKIIEYLKYDRKILALTPPGSPVQRILKECQDSSVVVTSYDAASVAKGFLDISQLDAHDEVYMKRFKYAEQFDSAAVSKKFDVLYEAICT